VELCKPENRALGDIVLVKVKGNIYLHLIKPLMTGAFSSGTIAVVLTLGWARTAFTSTYAALEFLHACQSFSRHVLALAMPKACLFFRPTRTRLFLPLGLFDFSHIAS